ncbi:hypothetical protein PRK78_000046 [Emydomyces testavorans]|uniref:Uncharacterized protein n=1 Tax=Emydomyces testavorans TaxID=2070801 RepID=A0AAF0IFG4_9EURO|nr:hypothetical protein PRK78_000046 [Emydomyces testavorans]
MCKFILRQFWCGHEENQPYKICGIHNCVHLIARIHAPDICWACRLPIHSALPESSHGYNGPRDVVNDQLLEDIFKWTITPKQPVTVDPSVLAPVVSVSDLAVVAANSTTDHDVEGADGMMTQQDIILPSPFLISDGPGIDDNPLISVTPRNSNMADPTMPRVPNSGPSTPTETPVSNILNTGAGASSTHTSPPFVSDDNHPLGLGQTSPTPGAREILETVDIPGETEPFTVDADLAELVSHFAGATHHLDSPGLPEDISPSDIASAFSLHVESQQPTSEGANPQESAAESQAQPPSPHPRLSTPPKHKAVPYNFRNRRRPELDDSHVSFKTDAHRNLQERNQPRTDGSSTAMDLEARPNDKYLEERNKGTLGSRAVLGEGSVPEQLQDPLAMQLEEAMTTGIDEVSSSHNNFTNMETSSSSAPVPKQNSKKRRRKAFRLTMPKRRRTGPTPKSSNDKNDLE